MARAISVAFFFNADHESLGNVYGPPCTGRLLEALERLDQPYPTQILKGDLLTHSLAYDIERVSVTKGKDKRRTTGATYRPNMDRYKLILCELADSLAVGLHTIKPTQFLYSLAHHRIWTLVGVSISPDHVSQLEDFLSPFSPYLGLAEIDTGNPLHVSLFTLVDGVFFKDGRLHCRGDQELSHEEAVAFFASTHGANKDPVVLDPETYAAVVPESIVPSEISSRGRLTEERVAGKSDITHHQRVAKALLDYVSANPEVGELEFDTKFSGDNSEFHCEERKIKDYLLDRDHPDGGPKARFFIDILGIERNDWRYLADQIVQGMRSAGLFRVKKNNFGVSHGAFVLITGRNERTAVIQTGWEIRNGEPARLVTAYPEGEFRNDSLQASVANVVSMLLEGDERWAAIYDRAHRAGLSAAYECVPTPMIVDGDPIFEGKCGFAWINVPNARTGFARWLRQNGLGDKGHPSGCDVFVQLSREQLKFADTQSIEPKKAYAKAFANVLQANGITCRVESRLD